MASLRKIQSQGIAMMRAGLNKMPANFKSQAEKPRREYDLTTGEPKPRRVGALYRRQKGRCHLCGELMTMAKNGARLSDTDANIDHYVPRASGGSNGMKNLRAAHYRCNQDKGARFIPSCEPVPELIALD